MDISKNFRQLGLETFQENLSSAMAFFPWRPSLMRDRLDSAYVFLLAFSFRRHNGPFPTPSFLRNLDGIAQTMKDAAHEIEKRPPTAAPQELAKKLRQDAATISNFVQGYRPQPL